MKVAGLVLEQRQVAGLVAVHPDDTGHGGVVQQIRPDPDGLEQLQLAPVTATPSRIWLVNQPSFPAPDFRPLVLMGRFRRRPPGSGSCG